MEQDDDRPESAEGSQPGPRRSTFTPAPPGAIERLSPAGFTLTAVPADAPPPHPGSVVSPPPGSALPRPPQRRSLDDDELVSALRRLELREGGVLDVIEQLQTQLRIREQEAREFRSWESSMLAIGTPEALEVVETTRARFTGAIAMVSPASAGPSEQDVPTEQEVASEQDPTAAVMDPVVYDLVEPGEPPRPAEGSLPEIVVPSGADNGDDEDDDLPDIEPPVAPVESPRTEPGEVIIIPDAAARSQSAFIPEASGAEPTIPEQRTGRAFRLFWLWFASNSSVLSVVLGALLLSLGMSLRQSMVAALAGVALSFLPFGLGTLASKWSGQPTMVVSRASFGLVGNILPGILALVTRLLWGSVLLWFLASVTATLLIAAGADGGLSLIQLTIACAGIGFLVTLVVAFFGYRLLGRVQLVLSVASAALVIALIVVSWPLIDLTTALTVDDGPWTLVITGAILVFSFVGLVWATAVGDVARYQRPSGAAAGSMLSASFGNALPPFVLIAYGALLAASDPALPSAFMRDPIGTLTTVVPVGFLLPLIAAVGIGLLAGVILSIYTGGFALVALVPLRRELAVLVVGVMLGGLAITLAVSSVDFAEIFRDLATTLAVPTAAWLGIFAAETMIRNRRFDTRSLVQGGGAYPAVRWVNLTLFIIASGVGYGFTTGSAGWLAWQGYFFGLAGIPVGSEWAQADLGVLFALGVALLGPILFGVRAIRSQEAARD